MKKEQIDILANLLAQGKIVAFAEVRASEGRTINIKAKPATEDKAAREASVMQLVELHVEIGDGAYVTPVVVKYIIDKAGDPVAVAKGYTKGMPVFLELKGMTGDYGRLTGLEASAVYAA